MRLCQAPLTPEKSQSLPLRQTALLQKNRQSGKKTGKKPKWEKLSSSKTPRACSRSTLSRRTNRAASRRNRSFLPSRYWRSCLLHPAACSGIICNACRKVCRLQTELSWRRLPTSERLTNALTDMWIILKNTYHGNMFLSLIDSAIPEHLIAASAATPFRIRILIHGINENIKIRNSGYSMSREIVYWNVLLGAQSPAPAWCGALSYCSCASSACHTAAQASLGMRQSPRGLSVTEPIFGPSGRQLRLNCWAKKRR